MREFEHTHRARRFVYSYPAIILLTVLLVAVARGAWSAWEKREYAEEKAKEKSAELEILKERREELYRRVSRLETEEGREEEIREKFLVGKEGEGVIFITDPLPGTTAPAVAPEKGKWRAGFLEWFR